jgi:hypothetical protein
MKPVKQALYNSRTADKFVVRLPDGWREKIEAFARVNHRSMNSHLLTYIEACLKLEEAENFGLLEALLSDEPGGAIVVAQGPRVPYAINIPVMFEGHVWLVVKLNVEDGAVWADLERTDSEFEYDNGRRCITCLHKHLEPFGA